MAGLSLDESGGAEVGVVLPAAHQGRGVATEAIALLAGHAFGVFSNTSQRVSQWEERKVQQLLKEEPPSRS